MIEIQEAKNENFDGTVEELKERMFMYPHFIDGLLSGDFQEMPREEIEKIVDREFFSFEPLTPLDTEQEKLLRGVILKRLTFAVNHQDLRLFCGDVFTDDGRLIYGDVKDKNGVKLSAQEKLDIFFNPELCNEMRCIQLYDNGSTYERHGWAGYGNRDLVGHYFGREGDFKEILRDIRNATGKEFLKVLDLGCGMGKALQDMKDIDPHLETHGVTMEQELGMFNPDVFHYMASERLPADFRGQFDLITSNVSFRYYFLQHIALRNAVLALSKGGLARLAVSCERIPNGEEYYHYFKKIVPEAENQYEAMKILLGREVHKLKRLKDEGKIDFSIRPWFEEDNQGFMTIEKKEDFDETELND
ncbi:class I SAM-dependent methyltransferase [bacterium]|nr:class I SAM-dependent methyltransferase [bacterium]